MYFFQVEAQDHEVQLLDFYWSSRLLEMNRPRGKVRMLTNHC